MTGGKTMKGKIKGWDGESNILSIELDEVPGIVEFGSEVVINKK